MKFSERMGYSSAPIELQEHQMPDALRNGLWDACRFYFFHDTISKSFAGRPKTSHFNHLCSILWFHVFKMPGDTIPLDAVDAMEQLRSFFFGARFWQIYDFIEFLANIGGRFSDSIREYDCNEFAGFCNKVLERERAAFRFANLQLIKVTNEIDRQEVEDALTQDISAGVREHISAAAKHFSNPQSPDYRNSIKESISAVEAAIGAVLGKKSYGVKPLNAVAQEYGLHPALSQGFEKLYAYTSGADGIRHGIMDKSNITQEEARYMLVSCSAFANYLLAMKSKV